MLYYKINIKRRLGKKILAAKITSTSTLYFYVLFTSYNAEISSYLRRRNIVLKYTSNKVHKYTQGMKGKQQYQYKLP